MKNAALLTDGYKLDHRRQYPEGTEFVFSNWTPRSNRHMPKADGVIVFGIQYLCKKYLIEYFNKYFFELPKDKVISDFKRRIDTFLGPNNIGTKHIEDLHDLGYLPIEIKSLPEGYKCPIGVPCMTIINTIPKFFWVTNFLETIISNVLWLPMTSATMASLYKRELVRHSKATGFYNEDAISFLCHDFSMRGMAGLDASIESGMAHLLSFTGSETIPAIEALEEYYNANAENELIAGTVPATEHSVMCAGGMDDEFETFKRLMTEIYPNGFVSIVSDSWDFWNVIINFLPKLKDTIMARDGRVVIRPDSGNPINIVAGLKDISNKFNNLNDIISNKKINSDNLENEDTNEVYIKYNDKYYVFDSPYFDESYRYYPIREATKNEIYVIKGAYECLWDLFGGSINDKGYKVLDSHIGLLYGDSITLARQHEIYKRLESKGFAATNLVLGIGSYTYNYTTRDALGFAMKATWCQIKGEAKEIFKDPKTVIGMTKKSLKGLVCVYRSEDKLDENNNVIHGKLYAQDKIPYNQWIEDPNNQLKTVFKNGKLIKETSLKEIRENIKNEL